MKKKDDLFPAALIPVDQRFAAIVRAAAKKGNVFYFIGDTIGGGEVVRPTANAAYLNPPIESMLCGLPIFKDRK